MDSAPSHLTVLLRPEKNESLSLLRLCLLRSWVPKSLGGGGDNLARKAASPWGRADKVLISSKSAVHLGLMTSNNQPPVQSSGMVGAGEEELPSSPSWLLQISLYPGPGPGLGPLPGASADPEA